MSTLEEQEEAGVRTLPVASTSYQTGGAPEEQRQEEEEKETHTASFGPMPPDDVPGRMNESVWKGHPESLFGPDGEAPWCNMRVIQFWEMFRGSIIGFSIMMAILNFYASKLDGDLFNFSVFGGGSSSSSSGSYSFLEKLTAYMRFALQWTCLLDLFSIISQVMSLKEQKYSTMYKILARLHSSWHGGNPPFIPVDTNAAVVQSLQLSGLTLTVNICIRVIHAFHNVTRAEKLSMALGPTLMLFSYMVFCSAHCHCGMRGVRMMAVAAGKRPALQQTWNGITVVAVSYCSHGPRYEYINGNFLVMPPFNFPNPYFMKNKPCWFNFCYLEYTGGALAMLLSWQASPLQIVLAILPFFAINGLVVLVTNHLKLYYAESKALYESVTGRPWMDIKEWEDSEEWKTRNASV